MRNAISDCNQRTKTLCNIRHGHCHRRQSSPSKKIPYKTRAAIGIANSAEQLPGYHGKRNIEKFPCLVLDPIHKDARMNGQTDKRRRRVRRRGIARRRARKITMLVARAPFKT